MKRGGVWIVIVLNLLVLIALVFIYPHLMVSPGAVVAAHAEIATDCFACHAPLRGADPQRCITCHELSAIGIRTTRGLPLVAAGRVKTKFHQDLIESDCMACHSDHAGPLRLQVSRNMFSHALLRPAVQERCETCHTVPGDSLHRKIDGNCLQCHSQSAWTPASFDHAKMFVLDRDHNTKCVTCHVNNDYKKYTCYGCHEHRPDKIRSKHIREGIPDFENCVKCHRSADDEGEGRESGRDGGRERRGD